MAAAPPGVLASREQNGGAESLTASYLRGDRAIRLPEERRPATGPRLLLEGARGHNLRGDELALPLGVLICVTGVSGSGKSSLINQTLYPLLSRHFHNANVTPLPYASLSGTEHVDKVIDIDQSPIGRTPRSNPATYTGLFGHIRDLFAQLPESRIRGYQKGRFSFNVKGGRCETCKGAGIVKLEMNFLPDVYVECETCKGKRYNAETLEVRYKSMSIADVLDATVSEALEVFENVPRIERKLRTLESVGLGYVRLGQQATTLSGGEAQRVKLAKELSRPGTGSTLYILDEPTTGLHWEDVRHLLNVLRALVRKGNTVLVIEHNMDVIKVADHVIDLGPGGGDSGGHILFAGSPEELATQDTPTAQYLREELERARVPAPLEADEEIELDLDALAGDDDEDDEEDLEVVDESDAPESGEPAGANM
jgi:excinuclease ABC subunit A